MKSALITGASSGIGAAFARLLAGEGYFLILHGRRCELLSSLVQSLPYPNRAMIVSGDLREDKTVSRLIEAGREKNIDMLINNAGYGSGKDFLDVDGDEVSAQLDMLTVHCRVPAQLCHELIPGMIKKGGGQVINVSSIAGEHRLPSAIMYSSTKTFLTVFSEALALRLKDQGVSVQALLPGFTVSDFHDRIPGLNLERRNRGLIRWQTSEEVATYSLKMIHKKHPRSIVISGVSNRIMTALAKLIIKPLYNYITRRVGLKI